MARGTVAQATEALEAAAEETPKSEKALVARSRGATVTGSVQLRAHTSDGRTRGITFFLGSQEILYCFSP